MTKKGPLHAQKLDSATVSALCKGMKIGLLDFESEKFLETFGHFMTRKRRTSFSLAKKQYNILFSELA